MSEEGRQVRENLYTPPARPTKREEFRPKNF